MESGDQVDASHCMTPSKARLESTLSSKVLIFTWIYLGDFKRTLYWQGNLPVKRLYMDFCLTIHFCFSPPTSKSTASTWGRRGAGRATTRRWTSCRPSWRWTAAGDRPVSSCDWSPRWSEQWLGKRIQNIFHALIATFIIALLCEAPQALWTIDLNSYELNSSWRNL